MCLPTIIGKVLRARGLKVGEPQKIETVKRTALNGKETTVEGVWRVRVVKLDESGAGDWMFVTRTEKGWKVWDVRPDEVIEKRLGIPYWGGAAASGGVVWGGYERFTGKTHAK